jgi:hypothetical protein
VKLQTTGTLKDAKVKSDYNGNKLTVAFELDLPRPEPIPTRKQWDALGTYQGGPGLTETRYNAKTKKGEKKTPPAEKHLQEKYETYAATRHQKNLRAGAAALRAGVLLALIGTKVQLTISPTQGAMLELLALPAALDAHDGDDQDDDPDP